MECSLSFVHSPSTTTTTTATATTTTVTPSFTYASKKPKKNGGLTLRAQFNGENDSTLQAAVNAASLRFQEMHSPEPLFVDPFAGCFVRSNAQMDLKKYTQHYCIATRFIDDKLLGTLNSIDELKQVVLLTDGMDTRPYRLSWPTSTILFDVSPERIFKQSDEKLAGVRYFTKLDQFIHDPYLISWYKEEQIRQSCSYHTANVCI
uniref:Uncharacterized protein n=1 Tax=Rhizophora mucronata TaxID=61149 RepID=A0A2P2INY9_RHIMU